VTDQKSLIEEIIAGLNGLTRKQLETIARAVGDLHIPVEFIPGGGGSFVDSEFSEEMSNLLALHHSNHEEALNKQRFEYVLKRCLIAQGHEAADLNPNPGESAYDVSDGRLRWSLKTESAKRLSAEQVKIEKFSEARWVREAGTPALCAAEVRERIPRHMSGYDRIVLLRAETRPDCFIYKLVEIPMTLLGQCVSRAEPDMFKKRDKGERPGISFGADFLHPQYGDKVFRMLLDSSVEKVRIWFQMKYCVQHGTWIVTRQGSEVLSIQTSTS
jgi:hypothetical protein